MKSEPKSHGVSILTAYETIKLKQLFWVVQGNVFSTTQHVCMEEGLTEITWYPIAIEASICFIMFIFVNTYLAVCIINGHSPFFQTYF